MRYKCSHCEHSVYEGTRRGKESTEGELFYHRDTEDTEFRIRKKEGRLAVRRSSFFLPNPKLRVLCVSVVNQFPSVPSSPLCVLQDLFYEEALATVLADQDGGDDDGSFDD
jgi:hypothetical protein